MPFGSEPESAWPVGDAVEAPLAALERAMRPALARPPCLVSFSGGRDSSAVLAIARSLALREGLDPPVPVTLRFPDAPQAREDNWQELVVRELGLGEWERLEGGDMDFVGPAARPLLRRHGVLWPPNAFLHTRILDSFPGVSLLSGIGGDQLLATWRWAALADVLGRRRRPRPKDPLRLVYVSLPARLRVPRERQRARDVFPSWVRPDASRRLCAGVAAHAAGEPSRWPEWVRWRVRGRDLCVGLSTHRTYAAERAALVAHPLATSSFAAALARAGGRLGFGDRTATMRALCGDLLPEALLARSSKATFGEVFWGDHARRFAERWDGSGVDGETVDPDALRRAWLAPSPDARAALLLQAAWLEDDRRHGRGDAAA